jgi:hypothetical protein
VADTSDKSTDKSTSTSSTSSAKTTEPKASSSTSGKAETTDARPDGLAVNPLLDNRTGDQAPDLDAEPKPQQIHGGYPGDDSDFEDPPSGERTDPTRAEGPHGRGPQAGPSSED